MRRNERTLSKSRLPFGLSVVCAAVIVLLAGAIESAPLAAEPRRLGLAAAEVGVAAALWAFRGEWLGWVG